MSAAAPSRASGPALRLGGRAYPVVLPSITDPRLHLAAVIVSLHVIGQLAFSFRLSIAQILLSLGACALLEMGIALRRERVVLWPASALLTGNGIAFILRVPGTEHGDWWSLEGWWIFVAASVLAIASKHLIRFRGNHVFNPSNIGLVLCFLALSETRAEPLDFWWGPMSTGLVLALVLIVAGGLVILGRLRLVGLAAGFWLAFAAGVGVLTLSGHAITARWHLGPIEGGELWRILVFSPEILVFLFFMITDPRTVPGGRVSRWAFGTATGLLAVILIAPLTTEYASKVAVLGALALVSAARPIAAILRSTRFLAGTSEAWIGSSRAWKRLESRPTRPLTIAALSIGAMAAFAGLIVLAGLPARPGDQPAIPVAELRAPAPSGEEPELVVIRSEGVVADLDAGMAREIVASAAASLSGELARVERAQVTLEPGALQGPPTVLATLEGTLAGAEHTPVTRTVELVYLDGGFTVVGERHTDAPGISATPPGDQDGPGAIVAPDSAGAAGEKSWLERSICAQAAADFDTVGAPPMGIDLAAWACDGIGLTGEQLGTQASAICEDASARRAGLSLLGEPSSPGARADRWNAVSRVDGELAANLRALRSLDPPEDYVLWLSRAIALYERMGQQSLQAGTSAAAGDEAALAAWESRYAATAVEADLLWTELGALGCSG